MRARLQFLKPQRGFIALLTFSLFLYLLPGRFAFPVTGRIASACANIAAFFQPAPPEETGPLIMQLRRDLVVARQELAAARDELYLLRKELESITGVKAAAAARFARIIPARVVLRRDASNFRCTVLVNRGQVDGVRPGLPVLWGFRYPQETALHACLVGTVDAVGPHACRVLLVADPGFRAPARMLESRDRVIVEGKSAGAYAMRLKHVGSGAEIDIGDTVLTSGSLGLFPAGLLIGTVAKVEGREYAGELEIAISSPVELDKLESVIIVELAAPEIQEENK